MKRAYKTNNKITRVISPTEQQRRITSNRPLYRANGWTTNGYWAIRTDLEPDYLKTIPTDDSEVSSAFLPTIERCLRERSEPLPSPVQIHEYIMFAADPCLYIDPDYFSLFEQLPQLVARHRGSDTFVQFYSNGVFVGAIGLLRIRL